MGYRIATALLIQLKAGKERKKGFKNKHEKSKHKVSENKHRF